MSTDSFKSLCAELVSAWDSYSYADAGDATDRMTQYIMEARAALEAQPEPQAPSDKDLHQLWLDLYAFHDGPTSGDVAEIARAVLARWGRHAIEPVPGVEDIHYAWELHDAEGEWQAGGSANSLDDVQREGNRYLQTYSQDGPHKLIIERHCVTTIEPVPGVEGADA
jgi:hypothetical protein